MLICLVSFFFFLTFQLEGSINILCNLSFHMLAFNICFRRRTLVAIGTHDLDTLHGPFTYEVGFLNNNSPF